MPTNTWPICGPRAWEERLQLDCLISWDSWKPLLTMLLTTGKDLAFSQQTPFQTEPLHRERKLTYNSKVLLKTEAE